MPKNNTTNSITTTQDAAQAADSSINQAMQAHTMASQSVASRQGAQNTVARDMQAPAVTHEALGQEAVPAGMPGLQQVQRQVTALRQSLQDLMLNRQYADGEIMTASAALDAQLEDYYRTLTDKKQPGMRTY